MRSLRLAIFLVIVFPEVQRLGVAIKNLDKAKKTEV
jgi:hypothetical protein